METIITVNEPYVDTPHVRILDVRPDGIDCIRHIGVTRYRKTMPSTRLHVHPADIEIVLCIRGSLAFEADGVSYPFLPGRLFVSTPTQAHRLKNNPKGMVLYRMLFTPGKPNQRILGLSRRESEWLSRSLAHLPKRLFQSTDRVRTAFETLFAVYDHERRGSFARKVKMKASVLELLVAVIEAARRLPPKPSEKIADIVRRIDAHPEADCEIAALAEEAGLSPVTFAERFKQATGLPPHAYLASQRIAAAKHLLKERTQLSVKAIADRLRFSSVAHFSNAFRNSVGVSPSAFRQSD